MTFELNMITISFSTLCPLVLWCILFFLIIFYFVPITAVVVWNNIDECSDNVYILVIGMSSIVTLWLWFFQKEEGFIFVNILHEKKKVLTVKIVFCLVIPRCIERALSNYWCFFFIISHVLSPQHCIYVKLYQISISWIFASFQSDKFVHSQVAFKNFWRLRLCVIFFHPLKLLFVICLLLVIWRSCCNRVICVSFSN